MTAPTLFDQRGEPLSDGSVLVREPFGTHGAVISREVDGVPVWGQVFVPGNSPDPTHPGHPDRVCDAMREDPAAFCRWWFQ